MAAAVAAEIYPFSTLLVPKRKKEEKKKENHLNAGSLVSYIFHFLFFFTSQLMAIIVVAT